jgi:hypothetical protein
VDDEPEGVSQGGWLLMPLHALPLQERMRKCDRGRCEAAIVGNGVCRSEPCVLSGLPRQPPLSLEDVMLPSELGSCTNRQRGPYGQNPSKAYVRHICNRPNHGHLCLVTFSFCSSQLLFCAGPFFIMQKNWSQGMNSGSKNPQNDKDAGVYYAEKIIIYLLLIFCGPQQVN